MKVWGLTTGEIDRVAEGLDMSLSNVRVTGRGRTGDQEGRIVAFKVDAKSSRGEYARRSAPDHWRDGSPGRRLTALCYHGWRDLTDGLFDIGAERVQTTQGSWRSREEFDGELGRLARINIGSMMYPFAFIQACEEKHANFDHEIEFGTGEIVDGELKIANVRMIKQSDIMACRFAILAPSHYRADSSCKCDDEEERAMMIREWEYEAADFAGVPLRVTA